jgi:hypothetical protein
MRFVIASLVFAFGCTEYGGRDAAPLTPPAASPRSIVTLAIAKDGVELATLRIAAGEPGTLELRDASSPTAAELRALWDQALAAGKVDIEMHLPTKDGSRGPLGTRFYKPSDADYATGVTMWLRYEHGYDVR